MVAVTLFETGSIRVVTFGLRWLGTLTESNAKAKSSGMLRFHSAITLAVEGAIAGASAPAVGATAIVVAGAGVGAITAGGRGGAVGATAGGAAGAWQATST